MAIDFPNSPTVNDIFTVAEKSWIWDGSAWKVYFNPPVMYVQDTPPSVPKTGDQWYESDTGQHFVYYDSTWVETGSAITTNVNANDLSGTTLAANVVNSSLTSVGTLTGLTIGGAGANRSITINAPSGYYAIQYFAINGTNEWHYEVTPSGLSWALVESGVAERIVVTSTGATFSGTVTATTFSGSGASLTSLTIDGPLSPSVFFGDWNQNNEWSGIRGTHGYLLTGNSAGATGVYLRSESAAHPVYIGSNNTNTLTVTNTSATVAGTVSPSATNTHDLGTAALRWRNIYTQDLHLSNGIGDYTVVEGEENLYLVNNKTNKSFKFALIEVDSSEVPKLSET